MSRASYGRRMRGLIGTLSKRAGNKCEVCGKPIAHNTKIFVGVTRDKKTLKVGDCCASSLTTILGSGLHGEGPMPDFIKRADGLTDVKSPQEADAIIDAWQELIAAGGKVQ